MAGEAETNDDNVVIPERAQDQPAEGGREQADEAAASPPGEPDPGSDAADPEEAGIVDQQGAALRGDQADA